MRALKPRCSARLGASAVFRKPLCFADVAARIRGLASTPAGHDRPTSGDLPTVMSPEEPAERFASLAGNDLLQPRTSEGCDA